HSVHLRLTTAFASPRTASLPLYRSLPCPSTTPLPPGPTLFPYTTLFRSLSKVYISVCISTIKDNLIIIRPKVGVIAGGSVWLARSEEHTSELQSRFDLVCRLLLEQKK